MDRQTFSGALQCIICLKTEQLPRPRRRACLLYRELLKTETSDYVGWLGEKKGRESWRRRVTWRLGEGDQGHELAVSSLVSHRRGTGDNLTPPSAKKALIEILIKV